MKDISIYFKICLFLPVFLQSIQRIIINDDGMDGAKIDLNCRSGGRSIETDRKFALVEKDWLILRILN